MRPYTKLFLTAAVLLVWVGLWAQEVNHSQAPDLLARLSYDRNSAGSVIREGGEGLQQICVAVSRDGDYRIDGEVPLAIVGIVPCNVTTENGAIHEGDLLVASSRPGYAMKGTDRRRMLGAVVGKALEPLSKGTGSIQVLITLR